MKNLTPKQIEQVKSIRLHTYPRFHGNRKKVGHMLVADIRLIISKKHNRACRRMSTVTFTRQTPTQKVRQCIRQSMDNKGTPYFKVMMEGSTGIYYCSPVHGLSDYNKSLLFDKTPQTIKLMNIFNAIISR